MHQMGHQSINYIAKYKQNWLRFSYLPWLLQFPLHWPSSLYLQISSNCTKLCYSSFISFFSALLNLLILLSYYITFTNFILTSFPISKSYIPYKHSLFSFTFLPLLHQHLVTIKPLIILFLSSCSSSCMDDGFQSSPLTSLCLLF